MVISESYNPNIESQYLRARYYYVATAAFLTEDSYLGNITEPLTLNRYNYCVSSPLNYVDPSGHYTFAQGQAAHRALQIEFMNMYPGLGSIEHTVTGYPYSVTGIGKIDMLLWTPAGYEVYEIKPLWQRQVGEENLPYISGQKQRAGYIAALEKEGERVSRFGTTFNPDQLVLPIQDMQYQYAVYYTFPDEPGMIYYSLKKSKPKPEYLPTVVRETEFRKKVSLCEPQNSFEDLLTTIMQLSILQQAGAAALSVADILFLPIILPKAIWDDMINSYNPDYRSQA